VRFGRWEDRYCRCEVLVVQHKIISKVLHNLLQSAIKVIKFTSFPILLANKRLQPFLTLLL
jgi:hypothetical protein